MPVLLPANRIGRLAMKASRGTDKFLMGWKLLVVFVAILGPAQQADGGGGSRGPRRMDDRLAPRGDPARVPIRARGAGRPGSPCDQGGRARGRLRLLEEDVPGRRRQVVSVPGVLSGPGRGAAETERRGRDPLAGRGGEEGPPRISPPSPAISGARPGSPRPSSPRRGGPTPGAGPRSPTPTRPPPGRPRRSSSCTCDGPPRARSAGGTSRSSRPLRYPLDRSGWRPCISSRKGARPRRRTAGCSSR